MGVFFFESSALLKRYVKETGTDRVESILDPDAENLIFVSRITRVELIATLARQGKSGQRLTARDAALAIGRIKHDFNDQYVLVDVTPSLLDQAADMAEKYGLKGYDAVQLAAGVLLNQQNLDGEELIFVSSDVELNEAAVLEGLTVENLNQP